MNINAYAHIKDMTKYTHRQTKYEIFKKIENGNHKSKLGMVGENGITWSF